MLLNQILSSKNQKSESNASQPDLILNNIIKSIEKPPKTPESHLASKNHLFDMFKEKQEDTNKSFASDKLLSKILSSKKAPIRIRNTPSEKPHYNNDLTNSNNKIYKKKDENKQYDLEENNKKLALPKKIVVKAKAVSNEYIDRMNQISDLNSLFKLDDRQIAQLSGALKYGTVKKSSIPTQDQINQKNERNQKEEQYISKKLMLMSQEEPKKHEKIQKYDPTAFQTDIKPNFKNKSTAQNNKKENNSNKINNNQKINNIINNPNNPKTNPPMKNDSKININSHISNNNPIQSNINKNKSINMNTNDKNNNKPKSYDPLAFSKKSSKNIEKKQYNPLESYNEKNKENLKRKIQEVYSNDEEEDEEDLDDFIDDGEIHENIDFRSEIRKIMRYDPKKYRNVDYDDAAMEVGFNEIEKEENFARKVARKEDEREWKFIMQDLQRKEKKKNLK